jgi:hypothetical protein
VFILPRAGGDGADGLCMAAAGERVEPAPALQAGARPAADGCEVTALVPWRLLGFDQAPAEFPFELIVDTVDPASGGIVQIPAFDLPWDGWRRLHGRAVLQTR